MPGTGNQRASELSLLAHTTRIATAKIARVTDDAAAHARTALTDKLDRTREGRTTAAAVKRSPSYTAALGRLAELKDWLEGQIEDFRVTNYRSAWRYWRSFLPGDVQRPNLSLIPSQANSDRCRVAMIHGRTVRQDLSFTIDQMARSLAAALTVAGNRATNGQDANITITRWARGGATTITNRVRTLLVDSQTMADRLAGRDCIKPELLYPDPSLEVT